MSSDRYEQVCFADMIRALNELHYAGETQFYGTAGLRPYEKALYDRYGGSAIRRQSSARPVHIYKLAFTRQDE